MAEMGKKYELIDVGDNYNGNKKVYRIKALHDFGFIKKGDIGGYIESEDNLSQSGKCWVYDDAYVIDKARVYDDAVICTDAWIFDNAEVYGKANISGDACVYHHAKVFGEARVYDSARVYNSAQVFGHAVVQGNARVRGRMKASKLVTVIDNSEVIITIADERVHVYQSTAYDQNNLPTKYSYLIDLFESKNK